ncbi:DUF6712 family protein [Dyadobacter sp. CY323]|uniref:DUF6712 family protein n=1 Tax=Dyadobacter sp. CY323 TaxID=2907302 RepID=UPI001F19D63D|nr:DUF6712 family protein [Dyadobacter sp. CY323]MCE6987495.1 hypothetical protein [Dyadobacter sp. CY323]
MTLISSINQVREVIGAAVRKENTLDILRPYLDKTEEGLITSLIGADQLADLVGENLEGKKARLKKLVCSAIVWNGYQEAFSQALYEFTGSGVKKQDLKDTASLFRYQEEAVQKDIVKKADESIEALMMFLEANLADFPIYKGSAAFTQNYAYLISTPTALQKALPEVSKSYRMYWALRAYMERAERTTVKTVTGPALFQALKTKVRGGQALDENYSTLLELAQEYAAAETLLAAMPWMRVQFSPTGIRVASVLNNLADETPVNDDQTAWLMGIMEKRLDQTKTALRIFLNGKASPTVFPEYYASDLYRTPDSKKWTMPNNEGRKHFRM